LTHTVVANLFPTSFQLVHLCGLRPLADTIVTTVARWCYTSYHGLWDSVLWDNLCCRRNHKVWGKYDIMKWQLF